LKDSGEADAAVYLALAENFPSATRLVCSSPFVSFVVRILALGCTLLENHELRAGLRQSGLNAQAWPLGLSVAYGLLPIAWLLHLR